MMMMMTALHF